MSCSQRINKGMILFVLQDSSGSSLRDQLEQSKMGETSAIVRKDDEDLGCNGGPGELG